MFRARLLNLDFGPGAESLEVQLFHEHEIPWEDLAFPVIHETLKRYYAERKQQQYTLQIGNIRPTKTYKLTKP